VHYKAADTLSLFCIWMVGFLRDPSGFADSERR
jgi:hypothetical protein